MFSTYEAQVLCVTAQMQSGPVGGFRQLFPVTKSGTWTGHPIEWGTPLLLSQ
jgi:hypothetical protein